MKEIDFWKCGKEGESVQERWDRLEQDFRAQCEALVKVKEINSLKQGKGWVITYTVREAKVTQPIAPALALDLLNADLIGRPSSSRVVWFSVSTRQVEDALVIDSR